MIYSLTVFSDPALKPLAKLKARTNLVEFSLGLQAEARATISSGLIRRSETIPAI
jgi:hypothetical protein